MKTLVFSDTHLTEKFEKKKYNFLKKIISEVDFVVINGDFWDGELTTFSKFLLSPWKTLFPLLKTKHSVYLYGNHDRQAFSDNRVGLFSAKQTTFFRLKTKSYTYQIEHGNKILTTIDEYLPRFLTRYTTLIAGFFLQNFPPLLFVLKRANRVIKKRIKGLYKTNEILVCGHTHWAEIDLANNFINHGSIENGVATYLIIEDDKAVLRTDTYS